MSLKPGSPAAAERAREGRLRSYRRRAEEVAERIARGETWAEVAASYGVRDVKGFRRRVKRYVGEVDRRREVLSVLDEVREKLDELRARYE